MTDDPLIGKQLDEYRIDALMGEGKMASIYHAVDTRLGRQAAIKVIMSGFQRDPEYIERFEREARAIAQLEHPHIVQLYRYGEAEGVLYMAMKFIEGASLATVLASYQEDGEFIEPQEAARIVREIGQALDYAHGKGVVHRDVKPANIMLNTEGQAILTDFGLVLIRSDGTRGGVLGTPHYLAPEQALSSANAVPQSDIYSLGIVIYEMFTNVRPFEGDRPIEVAMRHITQAPRPPRELRPAISPELEAVILKAMAKKPEGRYQTGAELAEALAAALRAAPLQVVSTPAAAEPEATAASPAEAETVPEATGAGDAGPASAKPAAETPAPAATEPAADESDKTALEATAPQSNAT